MSRRHERSSARSDRNHHRRGTRNRICHRQLVLAGRRARRSDRFRCNLADDAASRLARDRSAGSVFARPADIADATGIAAAIDGLAKDLGGVDILTNNAAARAYGTIADATPESWDAILQTNITGLANCCRAALPHLRKSRNGSIVMVSSAFALTGRSNMGQYDATKAAILAMTRVLACEEAAHGIRVNAVCPGSTLTPWTASRAGARGMSVEELKERGAAPSLLNRWAAAGGDRLSDPVAGVERGLVHYGSEPRCRWRPERDLVGIRPNSS